MKKPPAKKPKTKKAPKPAKPKASPKAIEVKPQAGMWAKVNDLMRRK